jgi:cytochrome d ubiquinol oxidase subunit I
MELLTPFTLLAFIILIHFTFVNINIGLGVFSFAIRWRSVKNPQIEGVARRAFKFLVASEAISGVYGTIITVVLAGFWTTLLNIATTVLFIPIYISLLGIILRLTSIITYWYSWNKVRVHLHLAIGFVMAASGFMIPLGFRYLFAFIDNPIGLLTLEPLKGDPLLALANPIYPSLIFHTWFGALSIGLLAAATGFAWASKRDVSLKPWAAKAALAGAVMVIPQGFAGFWFWTTLHNEAVYLFRSTSVSFFPQAKTASNVSFSFLGMVVLAVYLLAAGFFYYAKPDGRKLAYTLAPVAVLTMMLGEFTHGWGRLPYMVITGNTGLQADLFVNKLILLDPGSLASALIPIMVITSGFVFLIYLYLAKGFLE